MPKVTKEDVERDAFELERTISASGFSGPVMAADMERLGRLRDAAAQVGPMREVLEWVERETYWEDGGIFERIHAKVLAALSEY